MNRSGKIAVWLASGLALNAGLCLSRGALSSSPYESIVTRNIFGLNPPQAHSPKPPGPRSKITVDGIMTIFGGVPEALYKVAVPPHPPKPATVKSYILGEGQQQDDIEVKHIDVKKGVVTFSNHGVVEEIALTKAAPITTPTPVVMRPGARPAAVAFRGFRPPGHRNAVRPAIHPGQTNPRNAASNVSGNTSVPSYGNAGNTTGGQHGQRLTPEQQMIMIAAQHAEAQKRGDPTAKLFPSTPLDEAAGVVPNNNSSSPPSTP